jgi:hypothetical protein
MAKAFTLAVSQNKYMSTEDSKMHAVLTVAAAGLAEPETPAPEAAEVIVIDCSGSMSWPPTKISAARHATAAAIDALRDGVYFAVVEGTEKATMVYPAEENLVPASQATKSAAKKAVRHLDASGGTTMGAWLRLADRLLAGHPTALRHAILLTDGQDTNRRLLNEALEACAGHFVCDGRGIGDDYAAEELMRITSTLRGTADAIIEDADLVPEFAAIMNTAMHKSVPDVRLDVTVLPFARLRFVRQTFPTEIDLTPFELIVDSRTTGFSTGSWGEGEVREFHVCVDVDHIDVHGTGEDVQAAKVGLAYFAAGSMTALPAAEPRPVLVNWTEDPRLSSIIDPRVAHYTGHGELSAALRAAGDAYDAGDLDRATVEWGRAVTLAARLGHEEMLTRLRRIVDIHGDPEDGKVTVKPDPRGRDLISVWLGSSTSTRSPDPVVADELPRPAEADQTCSLGHMSPPTAKCCERCGEKFGKSA